MDELVSTTASSLTELTAFPYDIIALAMNYVYPRCECKVWFNPINTISNTHESKHIQKTFCSDECYIKKMMKVDISHPRSTTRQQVPDETDDALLSSYYDSYGWNIENGPYDNYDGWMLAPHELFA